MLEARNIILAVPNAIILADPQNRRLSGRIMKNLFQQEAVDDVLSRLDKLQPAS
jgi:hypothetical protein